MADGRSAADGDRAVRPERACPGARRLRRLDRHMHLRLGVQSERARPEPAHGILAQLCLPRGREDQQPGKAQSAGLVGKPFERPRGEHDADRKLIVDEITHQDLLRAGFAS
jgi:hypothetical protein